MQKSIVTISGITPANTKAAIEASYLANDFGYTVNIWVKSDLTRVYINKGRKEIGYVEFRDGVVTVVRSDSYTASYLAQIVDVLTEALSHPVAAPTIPAAQVSVATTKRAARNWDNLQNEGYSDGYNPYRATRTNFREAARMMAAEGGDC